MVQLITILSAYTIAGNLSANIIGKMLNEENKIKGFNFVLNLFFPVIILLYFSKYYFFIFFNTILIGIIVSITRLVCITKIKGNEDFTYIIEKMEKLYSIINIVVLLLGGLLYHNYSLYGVLTIMLFSWIIYYFIGQKRD